MYYNTARHLYIYKMNSTMFLVLCVMMVLTIWTNSCEAKDKSMFKKDMMRESIVYDKKTPHVFYCPIQKPSGFDKLIVKAKPLHKLCEYEGKPLPEDYKSDCYQDVDESVYACKEKFRIMMRMYPPGSEVPYNGQRLLKMMEQHDATDIHNNKKRKQG